MNHLLPEGVTRKSLKYRMRIRNGMRIMPTIVKLESNSLRNSKTQNNELETGWLVNKDQDKVKDKSNALMDHNN